MLITNTQLREDIQKVMDDLQGAKKTTHNLSVQMGRIRKDFGSLWTQTTVEDISTLEEQLQNMWNDLKESLE